MDGEYGEGSGYREGGDFREGSDFREGNYNDASVGGADSPMRTFGSSTTRWATYGCRRPPCGERRLSGP